jgi:hypothetical protein
LTAKIAVTSNEEIIHPHIAVEGFDEGSEFQENYFVSYAVKDSLKTLKMTLETLFLTRLRGREFRKQPLDSGFISCQIFSLIHGKDQHDERIILYGVNEPIALLAKLNLVAIF